MLKMKLTKRKSNKKEEKIWVKRDSAMRYLHKNFELRKAVGGSVSHKLLVSDKTTVSNKNSHIF